MKWQRVALPDHMAARGDACYAAAAGGRTYAIASIAGHSITATWSDATRPGPRLGSAELPIGSTYPQVSPHVHPIGSTFASVAEAEKACRRHHQASTQ